MGFTGSFPCVGRGRTRDSHAARLDCGMPLVIGEIVSQPQPPRLFTIEHFPVGGPVARVRPESDPHGRRGFSVGVVSGFAGAKYHCSFGTTFGISGSPS